MILYLTTFNPHYPEIYFEIQNKTKQKKTKKKKQKKKKDQLFYGMIVWNPYTKAKTFFKSKRQPPHLKKLEIKAKFLKQSTRYLK